MKKIFAFLLTIQWLATPILAQQIDESFAPQVTTSARVTAACMQADGKTILGGNLVAVGNVTAFGLVRLNVDGSLDTSFQPPRLPSDSYVSTIRIEPGGKIIVAGHFSTALPPIIRLNIDGSRDQTFTIANSLTGVYDIQPMTDNRYLIYHATNPNLLNPIVVMKADGTIDATFNIGAGPDSHGIAHFDMAALPDGKVVVGGTFTKFNNVSVPKLIRLNANGTVDNTFQAGTGPAGGTNPHVSCIVALPDGKFIVTGTFTSFNSVVCKNIVRLNSDGSVDAGFTMPGPSANIFQDRISKAFFHDNGILLASVEIDQVTYEPTYVIMKLKADGTNEPSFPPRRTNFTANTGTVDDPLLTAAGSRIILLGNFDKFEGVSRSGIAALDNLGNLEASFNPAIRSQGSIEVVKKQSDGKLIIGGRFNFVGAHQAKSIARLNADGTVDESFLTNLGSGVVYNVSALELQADGKLLVGGGFSEFNDVYTGPLVRLNEDGTRDASFNANIELQYIGLGVTDIVILPSGKILAGGSFAYVQGQQVNNLVMLDANGSLDPAFDRSVHISENVIYSLAVQSSGNILVAGQKFPSLAAGFLHQISQTGALLNDFDEVNFSGKGLSVVKTLPNGGFIVSGGITSGFNSTSVFRVYQFNASGILADQISVGGTGGGLSVSDLEVISDQEILISGSFDKVNGVNADGFAKVTLAGVVRSGPTWKIDGNVSDILMLNSEGTSVIVAGSFNSINSVPVFSVAKLNMLAPVAPSNLAFTTDDAAGKVMLTWVDQSDNETSFEIIRSESGNQTNFIVNPNIVDYTDNTAMPMKSYQYKVRAIADGNSNFSNTVDVSTSGWIPPSAPADLAVEELSFPYESVDLAWTDASTNELGFKLERSIAGGAFEEIIELDPNQQTVQLEFDFGIQYSYRARAYNAFGESSYSNTLDLPIITGIEEDNTSLSIFPNPVTDFVSVKSDILEPMAVTMMSIDGKLITSTVGDHGIVELNVKNLSNGLYILNVSQGKISTRHKLLKKE